MVASKLLDRFEYHDLPDLLWRVHDLKSQSAYLSDRSLYSPANLAMPQTIAELRQLVQNHLDWKSQQRSPFLSAFSDQIHSSR